MSVSLLGTGVGDRSQKGVTPLLPSTCSECRKVSLLVGARKASSS